MKLTTKKKGITMDKDEKENLFKTMWRTFFREAMTDADEKEMKDGFDGDEIKRKKAFEKLVFKYNDQSFAFAKRVEKDLVKLGCDVSLLEFVYSRLTLIFLNFIVLREEGYPKDVSYDFPDFIKDDLKELIENIKKKLSEKKSQKQKS